MSPFKKRFAVFDTETTGLTVHPLARLDQQPRIIEFAGIITDGVEILAELEFICNPGIAIEAIITEITGLTNKDLDDKPPFSNFVDDVGKFFAAADVAVAHNLSFDKALLEYDMIRAGLPFDKLGFPAIHCCTVEQTMPMYGRRMRLNELYELHVGEYVQKHRAMDDIKLLHAVCQKTGVYDAFATA